MNILFVLDYYMPKASANGVCVEKVVKSCIDRGHRVSILAFGQGKHPKDTNPKVYYCCQNGEDAVEKNAFLYYTKWFLPRRIPPYARKAVAECIVRSAETIIDQEKIETVVCVHLPIETLWAGKKLKNRFPQVRFLAYMLDSFSGGFLPKHLPEGYCKRRKIKWEKYLLDSFDHVILMQSSHRHHELYTSNSTWYRKAIYLDIPAFVPIETRSIEREKNSIPNMVFVGTMAEGVRTPYHLYKVLNCVDIPVRFFVVGSNTCETSEKFCKASEIEIINKGIVPYEEAQQIVQNADFLVSFGNKNPHLVPSKIFEYMSTGKPIIATYCSSDDSSLTYLKSYPNILLLDEMDSNYQTQAHMLKAFLQTAFSAPDFSVLKDKFKTNLPESIVNVIEKDIK
ncbi:MAG: glycosyltransferase [Clostridia bacterium]|nr:glycosyltransferase [Clostridia bacterium]